MIFLKNSWLGCLTNSQFCLKLFKSVQNKSNIIFLSISFLYDKRSVMYSDISTNDTDIAKFEKLKDNFGWFYSDYDRIEIDIHKQYIAVKDRKHIDNDVDLEALIKRLNLKNYDDSIAIEFINFKS